MNDRCHWCDQKLPKGFSKKEIKKRRHQETLSALREAGELIGRPRKVPYVEIRYGYSKGKTYHQIADKLGTSIASVHRAVTQKETK